MKYLNLRKCRNEKWRMADYRELDLREGDFQTKHDKTRESLQFAADKMCEAIYCAENITSGYNHFMGLPMISKKVLKAIPETDLLPMICLVKDLTYLYNGLQPYVFFFKPQLDTDLFIEFYDPLEVSKSPSQLELKKVRPKAPQDYIDYAHSFYIKFFYENLHETSFQKYQSYSSF